MTNRQCVAFIAAFLFANRDKLPMMAGPVNTPEQAVDMAGRIWDDTQEVEEDRYSLADEDD